MPTLQAYEVLYSRVEASYSPTRRSGYQVVYHSPSLPDAVVREVENRLRCFSASQISIRYQFFRVSGGWIALAASREIEEIDTRVVDQAGRKGPFIAHCLLISPADFEAFSCNPFTLFDLAGPFALDVEAMLQLQREHPAQRDLFIELMDSTASADYHSFPIEGWKLDDFKRLWYAALEAQSIIEQQRVFAIQIDDETDMEMLLRLFFAHLPALLCTHCTFNTFVDNCQPAPGIYWATGGFRKNPSANAIHIRLERKTFSYTPAGTDPEIEGVAERVYHQLRATQGLEEANPNGGIAR